jgi:hypothetical protein
MPTPSTATLLSLLALLLAGCGKTNDGAPTPPSEVITKVPAVALSIPADPSMPSAASAASSASTGTPVPAREAGRTNATLTRSQEAGAMPVAGQNNDHSAPLASAEPASAPR